jgi:uncharacterized membrane protein YbhN (UPF0104 family)
MPIASLIHRSKRVAGPVLSVLLFTTAAWVLHHELKLYHFNEIVAALRGVTAARTAIAIVVTLSSYAVMSCYDVLALRYIRRMLSYRQIGLASFVGYSFSNNIGLSMITGASIRYRLYSAWGLSTENITKVVVFCSLSLWLGVFCPWRYCFYGFSFRSACHRPCAVRIGPYSRHGHAGRGSDLRNIRAIKENPGQDERVGV